MCVFMKGMRPKCGNGAQQAHYAIRKEHFCRSAGPPGALIEQCLVVKNTEGDMLMHKSVNHMR